MRGGSYTSLPQELPYFVVIFSSVRSENDDGYAEMATRMVELAAQQPGFLGVESLNDGVNGVTLSYWTNEEAIARWRSDLEHQEAQLLGRAKWYEKFQVRVARVERHYGFR